MPKPIESEKYGYLCPVCCKPLIESRVKYEEIIGGIFKSGKTITDNNFDCKNCGWAYYSTEVE